MDYIKTHFPIISSLFFILVILIAHFAASNNYVWTKHTISHLGSQGYAYKWIMQIGFLGFGLLVVAGALLTLNLKTLPILFYGACIALTGVFCAEPFSSALPFDHQQDSWHSFFAQFAGISFCIAIISQLIHAPTIRLKTIHFIFFLLVMGLSASFGLVKQHQGIVQRLLYAVSLLWFACYFES